MKWLREKKRVRKTADLANAALDQVVRERWPEPLRTADEALVMQPAGTVSVRRQQAAPVKTDPAATLAASKSHDANDEAYRAHLHAEKPSTKQSGNSAPASLAKAVEKRSNPGTCTKKRFAKQKPSFTRGDESGQEPPVDRHSHHGIHADGM
jgi:hypothetical protein